MNPVVKTIERHKQANKSIKATTGKMSKIYMDARERLNEKLQRYVLSHANPAYGTWFVELINELERNYAKLEEKFVEEMGRAIPYVAESYYREALNDIGKSIIGKLDKAKIELFRKDAFTHIAGMTTNMQKSDVAWLRQTAADVFRLAGVGGMTAQETKQMMLAKILMRPEKFQFTDAGGRMWDNKTYCEMLARTVLLNAGRQTYFDTCAENGNDVVRVTVSGNACPACAVWENRLLSISGVTPGLPTVEEATNAGLCHPNCTHSFVAVPDYVRDEDFTKNGRPKKGLNSPDNVIKDDKEAWKKYRDSLKPKKRKISDSDGGQAKPDKDTPENKKVGSKSLKTANKGIPEIEQPELYQSMTTNNQGVNKPEQKEEFVFKPAKTIEEARKYMEDHIAKYIDLPKATPLSVLNAANELISRNMKKFGFKQFEMIARTQKRKVIAGMATDNSAFVINQSNWKKIINNPSEMFDINVRLDEQNGRVRFLAIDKKENFLRHVVDHEFGHAVFNRSKLENKANLLNELFNKAKQNGDWKHVSGYGTRNPRELFAEMFAMFQRGDILPAYMKNFVVEVMK